MVTFLEIPLGSHGDLRELDVPTVNDADETSREFVCQGHCNKLHDRCTYNPQGTCSLTKGHEGLHPSHICSICRQEYA